MAHFMHFIKFFLIEKKMYSSMKFGCGFCTWQYYCSIDVTHVTFKLCMTNIIHFRVPDSTKWNNILINYNDH